MEQTTEYYEKAVGGFSFEQCLAEEHRICLEIERWERVPDSGEQIKERLKRLEILEARFQSIYGANLATSGVVE